MQYKLPCNIKDVDCNIIVKVYIIFKAKFKLS